MRLNINFFISFLNKNSSIKQRLSGFLFEIYIKAKKILLKKFKIQHTGVVYVETKENLICVFNQGEKINLLLKFFKNLNT